MNIHEEKGLRHHSNSCQFDCKSSAMTFRNIRNVHMKEINIDFSSDSTKLIVNIMQTLLQL